MAKRNVCILCVWRLPTEDESGARALHANGRFRWRWNPDPLFWQIVHIQLSPGGELHFFVGHLGLLCPEGSVGPKWWIICGSFDESLCANLGFAGDHIADKPNTHTIPHQSEPARRDPHCRQAPPCTPCNVPSSTPRPKSAHDHIADSEQPEAMSEPQLITSLSHTRPNLIFVLI